MSRTDTTTPTPAAPDPGKRPSSGVRPTTNVPPAGKPATPGARPMPPSGGARPGGNGASGGGAPVATSGSGGMPPIDQLQGRPIGRVLTKMGKVTREQVVEALTFQKSKGGALGRILIDLG